MKAKRLKLRDKYGELFSKVEDWNGCELDEWIASRIPLPPPSGTECEDPRHPDDNPREAVSYCWKIIDGHVCYNYICEVCSFDYEDLADPEEYPTTDSGFAISPEHCIK